MPRIALAVACNGIFILIDPAVCAAIVAALAVWCVLENDLGLLSEKGPMAYWRQLAITALGATTTAQVVLRVAHRPASLDADAVLLLSDGVILAIVLATPIIVAWTGRAPTMSTRSRSGRRS